MASLSSPTHNTEYALYTSNMSRASKFRYRMQKYFVRDIVIPVLAYDYTRPIEQMQQTLNPTEQDQCADFYAIARYLRSTTGLAYNVDHIDPLSSPFVCGLHTPSNLQIMLEVQNTVKKSRFYPYREGKRGKREVLVEGFELAIALGLGLK